jgi:SNF2 family DNA or RNA helicase
MTESTDESSDLVIHLFMYQMKWLSLALKQERSVINGGILVDGMGLGETIQATALVLAKRELQKM